MSVRGAARLAWWLLGAGASAGTGAGLVACFDLFHSTSGILSECQLDAASCEDGGGIDAGALDAGTDFCDAFTPTQAVANAQRACAWLGACQTPLGNNAFGSCMYEAMLAYDCVANPNHPVRGETHALWDCLWQVQSCTDVRNCILPGSNPPMCQGGGFTGCGNQGGNPAYKDVRIECVEAGVAVGESCALTGRTCSVSDSTGTPEGTCTGTAGVSCSTNGCVGSQLHLCSGGTDIGLDCASTGAGQCTGLLQTGAGAAWVACVPSGEGMCAPDASVTCVNGGYATSCPAAVPESLGCSELLQTFDAGNAGCVAGPPPWPFDWRSGCAVSPPQCSSDSCEADDAGDAGLLVGCAKGAAYALDCASVGLGPCRMVATNRGTMTNAACTPPP